MFCPECEAEYREGFTECSDCGVALVATLQREEIAEGLTLLLETVNSTELAVVIDRLEKAEVPYVVEAGTALALFDGRDDQGDHTWQARLSVTTGLLERAERIVRQVRLAMRL